MFRRGHDKNRTLQVKPAEVSPPRLFHVLFLCRLSTLPSYYIPRDGTLQSYQDFVNFLPNVDVPELFGQHQNAEINSLLVESKATFDTLLSLQSQATVQTTENKEVKVTILAVDLFDKIPTPIDYEKTKRIIGSSTTPLNIILLQEIQRYNTLLVHIASNLVSLRQAIAGFILMTADLELVFQAIYDGQVPTSWQYGN
jgi:dynein heavy chain, axonemal